MYEDRKRCLAAGMNDYLTKPFHPEQVAASLAQVMGWQNPSVGFTRNSPTKGNCSSSQQPTDTELEISPLEHIRCHLETTYAFEAEQVDRLLEISLKSLSTTLAQAEQAQASNEIETLADHCHSLKGILLNLGLREQALLAAEIEQKAGNISPDERQNLLKELSQSLETIVEHVQPPFN
jgi:HPt (histidine-containing phosphotransfer) domain-containing protein